MRRSSFLFLTFLHHLYYNSRTKREQSFLVRPTVRPLPSYPPALLQTTLTEPECRHLTPRAHWHHLKPRMGSVCAAEPRIIGQSGVNEPVQTVWTAAFPPCDEAHRESSRGASWDSSGPVGFSVSFLSPELLLTIYQRKWNKHKQKRQKGRDLETQLKWFSWHLPPWNLLEELTHQCIQQGSAHTTTHTHKCARIHTLTLTQKDLFMYKYIYLHVL